jgi:membrane protease YdiL (CAAX protease family)
MLERTDPVNGLPIGSAPKLLKRDRFSTWSLALIALVFVFQIVANDGSAFVARLTNSRHSASTASVSTESFQQLVMIDTEVKQAYVESLVTSSSLSSLIGAEPAARRSAGQVPVSAFHATLEKALADAISGLRSNTDSIYFARRVILLRGLLSIDPFVSIGRSGHLPGMSSPLAAYDKFAAEDPEIKYQVVGEKNFWKSSFSPNTLSEQELHRSLTELNRYPTLLFYSLVARYELCQKAGAYTEARHINHLMQYRAIFSTAGLGVLVFATILFFLVGAVVIIGFLSTAYKRQSNAAANELNVFGTPGLFDQFVDPLPELIAPNDRKLRAGDLLDCFAIYLVCLTGISTVVSLLMQLIPESYVRGLSQLGVIYLSIGPALVSYVGASALALYVLHKNAQKRGGSLSVELGLSPRDLLRNITFGAIGWGVALILVVSVGNVAERLLHSLPAPENPALPMLSFAPNSLARFALYTLAAIAAPFFEETFFRGVLLNALLLRFRPVYACLLTGLMFGCIHPVGLAEALSLAALGTVFAWMAYLRKSLMPGMFAHFLQNSYAYLAVYFSFALIIKH